LANGLHDVSQDSNMTARQQARVRILLVASIVAAGISCSSPDGYPPVARIGATPRAIPEHDGFHTAVTLDATASADPIDDPAGARPLGYRWEIIGDEYRVQSGATSAKTLTVTFLGSRPATVQLTVTDETGLTSTAQEQLQLTLAGP
jgi:hypothetical protein